MVHVKAKQQAVHQAEEQLQASMLQATTGIAVSHCNVRNELVYKDNTG